MKRKVVTVTSKEKGNSLTVGIIDDQGTVVLGVEPNVSVTVFLYDSVSFLLSSTNIYSHHV